MLRSFCLALLVLLVGCDASTPETDDAFDFSLQLGGALDASFADEAAETEALARVQETPDGQQSLVLKLRARRVQEGDERVQLDTMLPLDEALTPGRYRFDLDEPMAQAAMSYLIDQEEVTARYRFRGTVLDLEVVRVDDEFLAGRLSVRGEQTDGVRILYGQHEQVELAGPVTARVVFEAEIVE